MADIKGRIRTGMLVAKKAAKTVYTRLFATPFRVLKGLAAKQYLLFSKRRQLLPDVPEASFQTYRIGHPPAETRETAEIPRIIWSYWNSPTLPLFVQRCMATWTRHCPDFSIRILNDENLPEYLPGFPPKTPHLAPAKRADWIRLELMARYGGIWLDATTVLTRPLDWAVQEQRQSGADFVGYWIDGMTSDHSCPVVENWFLAAPPGSPFIADWRREFVDHALHNARGYIAHLRSRDDFKTIVQNIAALEYLSCHVAAQAVLRRGGGYTLRLLRAQDDAFAYHEQSGWTRSRLWDRLAFRRAGQAVAPRLVKLRGNDRRYGDEFLAYGVFLDDSFVARHLA